MASRRKRRRNLDNDLERWIEDKARLECTPAEIYRHMQLEPQFNERENLPSLRTIQRVVEDSITKDTTATWTIGSVKVDVQNISLDDARLILDILRSVFLLTRGRKRSFTIKEAQWVLKVAKLAPGLFHETIWTMVQNYMYNEAEGIDNENLDIEVALDSLASSAHMTAADIAWENDWYEQGMSSHSRQPTMNDNVLYELNKRGVKTKEIAELFGATEDFIKDMIKDYERTEVNK